MDKDILFEMVRIEIIHQQKTPVEIKLEHLLKEDLGLPSMKLVFIMTTLTSKLNVSMLDFSDHELLNLKSVSDIVSLFSGKIKS